MAPRSFLTTAVAVVLGSVIVVSVVSALGTRVTTHEERFAVEKVTTSKGIAFASQPRLGLNVRHALASESTNERSPDGAQIARSAEVSLYVDKVDAAIALAQRVTRRAGGDVFSLEADDEHAENANATLQVRVPAKAFDSTLSALSAIGNVRSRTETAEDVTSDMTDSGAKLRNLRSTEADILRIMSRSGNVSQVMDAEDRLSGVREQIETLEAQLKDLHSRVSYAMIDVSLQAQASTAPAEPSPLAQIATARSEASHAFVQSLLSLVAAVIWALVFLPYALALACGWLVYRNLRLRKDAVRR